MCRPWPPKVSWPSWMIRPTSARPARTSSRILSKGTTRVCDAGREQLQGQVGGGQRAGHGHEPLARSPRVQRLARHQQRAVAVADAAAARHQRVLVGDVRVGVERDRGHLVLALHAPRGSASRCPCSMWTTSRPPAVDLARGQAVEHERVVAVGAVRERDLQLELMRPALVRAVGGPGGERRASRRRRARRRGLRCRAISRQHLGGRRPRLARGPVDDDGVGRARRAAEVGFQRAGRQERMHHEEQQRRARPSTIVEPSITSGARRPGARCTAAPGGRGGAALGDRPQHARRAGLGQAIGVGARLAQRLRRPSTIRNGTSMSQTTHGVPRGQRSKTSSVVVNLTRGRRARRQRRAGASPRAPSCRRGCRRRRWKHGPRLDHSPDPRFRTAAGRMLDSEDEPSLPVGPGAGGCSARCLRLSTPPRCRGPATGPRGRRRRPRRRGVRTGAGVPEARGGLSRRGGGRGREGRPGGGRGLALAAGRRRSPAAPRSSRRALGRSSGCPKRRRRRRRKPTQLQGKLKKADDDQRRLEDDIALLTRDLELTENEIIRLKAKLRGLDSKAEASSAIAEARILMKRYQEQRGRTVNLARCQELVERAEQQILDENYGAASFFAQKAQELLQDRRRTTPPLRRQRAGRAEERLHGASPRPLNIRSDAEPQRPRRRQGEEGRRARRRWRCAGTGSGSGSRAASGWVYLPLAGVAP